MKTLLIFLVGMTAWAASYTAADCNYASVNTIVNGPTHVAVAGDTIIIPAGTCTWTSSLLTSAGITITGVGTPNTGPSTFGAGTASTIINDNAGGTYPLFTVTSLAYGQTFTLALLDIEPGNTPPSNLKFPVSIAGVCNSSGCPFFRVNNIVFGLTTQWIRANTNDYAAWMIVTDNVFGVIDHNTLPMLSGVDLADPNLSAYLGVGANGDNSWAQPDTTGGPNNVYMENNSIYTQNPVADCEIAPYGGGVGGCRYVGRFNQITASATDGLFGVHGLDTNGRPQGGREVEVYGNTISCVLSSCNSMVGPRSGTGFIFGNTTTRTGSAYLGPFLATAIYRTVWTNPSGWGACGGSSPFDINDGVTYYSGTITSSSGGYPSALTMTDTSQSWTASQFIPSGAPYSVYDVTQGFWMEIASNTTNSLTTQKPISEGQYSFANGDSYQILRSTVCADSPGRGVGGYVSGSTPSPSGPLNQALDPLYEWNDSAPVLGTGNVGTDTGKLIANRDWYTDGSTGSPQAQTSPTSPFNGTSGVGFGTLADRPTTCTAGPGGNTPGVGYWATDQGNWNLSGNGFGNGVLYACNPTNTWALYYTPYTYPDPLTGPSSGSSFSGNLSLSGSFTAH